VNNIDLIFKNDGEMGQRFAAKDWSATDLGPAELWPDTLKSTLNICLHTDLPIAIYWGPQFSVLFNDAYVQILANKSEMALGAPVQQVWTEVWPQLEDDFISVRKTGKAISRHDVPFVLNRNGFNEETYFDYTLSPILDSQGQVAGLFNTVIETSYKVIGSRRSAILQQFLEKQNQPSNTDEALVLISEILAHAQPDILRYEIEISGEYRAELQFDDHIRIPFHRNREQISGSVVFYFPEIRIIDRAYISFLHSVTGYIETQLNNAHARSRDADLARLNQELEDSYQTMAALNEELAASNEEQLSVNEQMSFINEQLNESRAELLLAIDAAHLATWDLNPLTGRFAGNDLIKEWFGLEPEDEIELSKATDVIADEDRKRVIQDISNAMNHQNGGSYDTYYTIINPIIPVPRIVRAKGKALFAADGTCIRMSGVLQDVTEQKQDEQRKNDFIAMVSHELKTPLTSMNGYMQIVQLRAEKNEDAFTLNMVGKSTRQISKMITLINGFLNVSRLESGKIHIDLNHYDMALLIKEVEEEALASITSHKIVFAPVEETFVMADRDKIGHVINNLISNAVKYSPAGSTIKVACVTKNNVALISVEDMGIGISKEDIPKLFDRYYRVQGAGTSSIGGFGIGLYLCCEIIKRHNGKLWVKSVLGKGSTFNFCLPVYIS
jgi:nitrogen-specific signal transduction histidine kinase